MPRYFNQVISESGTSENETQTLFNNEEDESDEQKEESMSREEEAYNESSETDDVIMNGGHLTYCAHFKYLGSYMSFNLRDDFDINSRISSANKSFGSMKIFYGRPEVNTRSKAMFFRAIQINLLLWGCESWALRKDLLNKLERFVR